MKTLFYIALVFIQSCNSFANIKEDGDSVLNNYIKYFNEIDMDKILTLFTDQVLFFGTSSREILRNKSDLKVYFDKVKAFKKIKYNFIRYESMVISPDVVLYSGVDRIEGILKDKKIESQGRLSFLVKKTNKGTKIIHFHRSSIPE